jgi:hypothetical protein
LITSYAFDGLGDTIYVSLGLSKAHDVIKQPRLLFLHKVTSIIVVDTLETSLAFGVLILVGFTSCGIDAVSEVGSSVEGRCGRKGGRIQRQQWVEA